MKITAREEIKKPKIKNCLGSAMKQNNIYPHLSSQTLSKVEKLKENILLIMWSIPIQTCKGATQNRDLSIVNSAETECEDILLLLF